MAANGWHRVAAESDVEDGHPLAAEIGRDTVLLARVGGRIYACAGKCTHYGAPLADGALRGRIITCPWHNARFDVTNGQMVSPPALDSLRCYEVRVESGDVYVRPTERVESRPSIGEGATYAIVGAGAAGNAAAETLRRDGFAGRVLLITGEPDRPYDRPNLSKDFLAGTAEPDWIPLRPEGFYSEHHIELLTGRRVVSVDCAARLLRIEDGETIPFDKLLVATGGKPRELKVPGAELDGVRLLRTKADAEAIVADLDGAASAVIVGGGFIGMEAAAALAERGVQTHVVARDSVPLSRVFGERIGRWLQSVHEQEGTVFHLGRQVDAIEGSGRLERVILSDGTSLPADVAIVGIGITPAVDWLSGTGLVVDGAVPVNERLETGVAGIFEAGDIASVPDPRLGERIRVEHWVVSERHGQHAARAMLGAEEAYTDVPFFWTQQHGKSLSYAGFARTVDRIAYRGSVEGGDFLAGYYEGDRLRAIASLWRDAEFIAASEILRAGGNVSFEDFSTDTVNLCEMSS